MRFSTKLIVGLIGLLGFLVVGTLHAPKASAISATFPDNDQWVWISERGDGHWLHIPNAKIRYFYNINSDAYKNAADLKVTINYMCRGGSGFDVLFKWGNGNSKVINDECNGKGYATGSFQLGGVSKGELKIDKDAYGDNLRFIDLNVGMQTDNSSPALAFYATSVNGGGLGSFAEVPAAIRQVSYGTMNNYSGPYTKPTLSTAFGLWDNDQNQGVESRRNFTMNFRPACNWGGGTTYLRWYDADDGQTGTQTSAGGGITFKLFEKAPGSSSYVEIKSANNLGGDDVYKELAFTAKKNHLYRWTWYNVSRTNGVQLWMPFSSMTSLKCPGDPKPPKPPVVGSSCTVLRISESNRAEMNAAMRQGIADNGGAPRKYNVAPENRDKVMYTQTRDRPTGDPRSDGSYSGRWDAVNGDATDSSTAVRIPDVTPSVNTGDLKQDAVREYTPNNLKFNVTTTKKVTLGTVAYRWERAWIPATYKDETYTVHHAAYWDPMYETDDKGKRIPGTGTFHAAWDETKTRRVVDVPAHWGPWEQADNFEQKQPAQTVVYNVDIKTVSGCYSATCTIEAEGEGDRGQVLANNEGWGKITVRMTLTNTSKDDLKLKSSLRGYNLSMTVVGYGPRSDFSPGVPSGGLEVGDELEVEFDLWRHYTGPAVDSVAAYPDYYGLGAIGGNCGTDTPLNVYVPFLISQPGVTAKLHTTSEDPTRFEYQTRFYVDRHVRVKSSSSAYKEDVAGIRTPIASVGEGNYGPGWAYPLNNPNGPVYSPKRAGDSYCTQLSSLEYTKGYVGPGGPTDLYDTQDPTDPIGDCDTVANEPYLHIFNSDIKTNGSVQAYTEPSQPAAASRTKAIGSGAQFAARSNGPINGFSSAILRAGSSLPQPLAALGLSFSNTQNVTNNPLKSEGLGGQFGASYTMSNFYSRATQGATATSGVGNISSIPDGTTNYTLNGGTLTINNSINIPNGKHSIIKVDGNVYIRGNITLSSSWSSLSDVPSLYIIAKGDIYIDPAVTRLDGVYIAQERDDHSRGSINTCAYQGGNSPANSLNDCANQLVVYGSFASKKTYFNRGFGSLRNGTNGERLKSQNKTCDQRSTGVTIGTGDCAAEIFIFTPEIYLSNPGFVPTGGATSGKYDYITSLSPVL